VRTCVQEMGQAAGVVAVGDAASRATAIGSVAREVLTARTAQGAVVAVLANAVYLTTDAGEVVWACTGHSIPHRRYLHVPGGLEGVRPGERFVADGGVVRVGAHRVDLRAARLWCPPAVAPASGVDPAAVRERFAAVANRVRATTGGARDGVFLRHVIGLPLDGVADRVDRLFVRAACAVAGRVRTACRAGDLASLLTAGRGLVGLGPGFTPAGDDYLGGLLFTLHQLDRALVGARCWDGRQVAGFLSGVRGRTGAVSHALLSDLAYGHGPGPLHELVAGLVAPAGRTELTTALRDLGQLGHSSGRDLVAGVLSAAWWPA